MRIPAAGSKDAPKNPGELKDDTSSAREEKQVTLFPVTIFSLMDLHDEMLFNTIVISVLLI